MDKWESRFVCVFLLVVWIVCNPGIMDKWNLGMFMCAFFYCLYWFFLVILLWTIFVFDLLLVCVTFQSVASWAFNCNLAVLPAEIIVWDIWSCLWFYFKRDRGFLWSCIHCCLNLIKRPKNGVLSLFLMGFNNELLCQYKSIVQIGNIRL